MTDGRKRYIPDNAFWENLRARWAEGLQTMVDEGRLVSAVEFQSRRNLTVEQVQIAERESRIFSLGDASGAMYYPAFFCTSELIGMAELVSQRLVNKTGFDKWLFFSHGTQRLGGRNPLQALEDGDLDLVLHVAECALPAKFRRAEIPEAPSTT